MINQKEFLLALKFVSHAMAKGDLRFYLNGTMFRFKKNSLELIATDGHRLASVHLKFEHGIKGDYIISNDSVKRIIKIFPHTAKVHQTISMELIADSLMICGEDGVSIVPNTINGKFPDTEKLIKESLVHEDNPNAAVNPLYMAEACKASLMFGNGNAAKIILKGHNRAMILQFTKKFDCMSCEALVLIMPTRV